MATALAVIGPRAGSAPLTYTVVEPGTVDLQSVFAAFNGSGASGAWRPALTIKAQNGTILARVFPDESLAVGDTADVTFVPFRGGGGAAAAGGSYQIKVINDETVLTTGDGKVIIIIPPELDGLALSDADAYVTTVSSSGTPTVQIRNVTGGVDMLSTKVTIDANEFTSYTAATPPVIDAANAGVETGDRIAVDVDGAGTGAEGLGVVLVFS